MDGLKTLIQKKAITLGFESEKNFEEIIKVYLEDDFGKVL